MQYDIPLSMEDFSLVEQALEMLWHQRTIHGVEILEDLEMLPGCGVFARPSMLLHSAHLQSYFSSGGIDVDTGRRGMLLAVLEDE
jgi:hypothetical protein